MTTATLSRLTVLAALVALALPLAALATGDAGKNAKRARSVNTRVLYATDTAGNLHSFPAALPWLSSAKQITGLPAGVSLSGIDFRPATGDLYALGSDKVVYRVNPRTAIAVAEGPAFEAAPAALKGDRIGFDFNPTVDKIRVTSDADDSLRLDPDAGSLLASDKALTPAGVTVVGSAYTSSSFAAFANRPAATMLFAYDTGSGADTLWLQQPANDGTLMNPRQLGLDLGRDVGFDIAGARDVGYVAGTRAGRAGAELFTVDVTTGATRKLGRIGSGDLTITGLAAWQDQ
ncbi:MAG TPA: DUF4394 domain-containing protein [Gaiellaceae bacterium]|jgi:hypothetical protein